MKSKNETQINNAGLYAYSNRKKYKPIDQSIQSKKIDKYENIFESFNDIIDYNDCVNAINEQTKIEGRKKPIHKLGLIIRKNQTKHDLATFLTAACYNPARTTLLASIKNNHFTTWPGMDIKFMSKHLTDNINSAKGHQNQERQGLQSTKAPIPKLFDESTESITTKFKNLNLNDPDILHDAFPNSDSPNIKTHDVAYSILELPPKNIAYTDLTGRFPYRSSRGNEYIMVGYHFDANAIVAEPIKNRQAQTLTDGWKILNSKFAKAGIQPNTYILDN